MGIIGFYVQKYEEGKNACIKAIEQKIDEDLNRKNLQFYLDLEKKDIKIETKKQTKKEFVSKNIEELRFKFPRSSEKELKNKAEMLWKIKN